MKRTKLGRPGRPKELTSKQFRLGVERYFSTVCTEEIVTRDEPVETVDEEGVVHTELDRYGHAVKRRVPVLGMDGEPIRRVVWIVPPSVAALCLFIGIDKSTFSRYAKMQPSKNTSEEEALEYRASAAWARSCMEMYLEEQLSGKQYRGAMFNLQENYGWKQKTEVTVHGGVEEFLKNLDKGVDF